MTDVLCEVLRAGVTSDGRAQIDLVAVNPPQFSRTWFLSKPSTAREVLATALVAISTDKLVECVLPDPPVPWSEIEKFLLVK
jgi:hypothetical protein